MSHCGFTLGENCVFFFFFPTVTALPTDENMKKEHWVRFPELYSRFSLLTNFTHNVSRVYMSIPASQFIPPPLSPFGVNVFVLYVCVSSFVLQTFAVAKAWKQPKCPSTGELIKKMWYNGILLSYKKEQNWVICKDVDGPRDCRTEGSKSEREKQISYINAHTWNLEKHVDDLSPS